MFNQAPTILSPSGSELDLIPAVFIPAPPSQQNDEICDILKDCVKLGMTTHLDRIGLLFMRDDARLLDITRHLSAS